MLLYRVEEGERAAPAPYSLPNLKSSSSHIHLGAKCKVASSIRSGQDRGAIARGAIERRK